MIRCFYFLTSLLLITTFFAASTPVFADSEIEPLTAATLVRLAEEPTIRIGLATNLRAVTVTTSDSQLTAQSPNEAARFLATAQITVSARAYRPPTVETYNLEIAGIATREEAEQFAKDIREAIEQTAVISLGTTANTWRVRVGEAKPTLIEAEEFRALLVEKGFALAQIVTETVTQPSSDALALSNKNPAVNSSVLTRPRTIAQNTTNINANGNISLVNPTAAVSDIPRPVLDPNLREVVVKGGGTAANFTALKPVSFGSTSERNVPVKLNGKPYRGRIEVFVNDRGTLTVVNVVKMEDYVRGVVPNELSLPALEAQKAQAVAARTYAIKNLGQFGKEGFDLLPTIRSQVYRGFSSENVMATRAVQETAGMVATYHGKPINAMYTSTCGGRTENVENVFDGALPYLRGVECSLEGRAHFEPFLLRSNREPPKIERESNVELTRQLAVLAVNGFQLSTNKLSDEYFADAPNENELRSWLTLTAARLNQPTPIVNGSSARGGEFASVLARLLYGAVDYADTLLSDADVNYQLGFLDGGDVAKANRADVAMLLRDGHLSLRADGTFKPNEPMSRARLINTIYRLAAKRSWFALQNGVTRTSADGKLILRSGKSDRSLTVRPDVFLLRQFGDQYFLVKETALIGGEIVNFHTDASGAVDYLEIKPSVNTATAERTSQFTNWTTTLAPSAVGSRLSRYVRGIGTLYDVRVIKRGYSRRAVDLEIVGSNGIKILSGGKIRSALRLKEQLFVINKRYDASGRVASYTFTGRGWGHGVGMCQVGAYGLAKAGLKYDRIIKHYYSGVNITKVY